MPARSCEREGEIRSPLPAPGAPIPPSLNTKNYHLPPPLSLTLNFSTSAFELDQSLLKCVQKLSAQKHRYGLGSGIEEPRRFFSAEGENLTHIQ